MPLLPWCCWSMQQTQWCLCTPGCTQRTQAAPAAPELETPPQASDAARTNEEGSPVAAEVQAQLVSAAVADALAGVLASFPESVAAEESAQAEEAAADAVGAALLREQPAHPALWCGAGPRRRPARGSPRGTDASWRSGLGLKVNARLRVDPSTGPHDKRSRESKRDSTRRGKKIKTDGFCGDRAHATTSPERAYSADQGHQDQRDNHKLKEGDKNPANNIEAPEYQAIHDHLVGRPFRVEPWHQHLE